MSFSEPTDQYLNSFSWNKIRYRADKSLGELISTLQKARCDYLYAIGPLANI